MNKKALLLTIAVLAVFFVAGTCAQYVKIDSATNPTMVFDSGTCVAFVGDNMPVGKAAKEIFEKELSDESSVGSTVAGWFTTTVDDVKGEAKNPILGKQGSDGFFYCYTAVAGRQIPLESHPKVMAIEFWTPSMGDSPTLSGCEIYKDNFKTTAPNSNILTDGNGKIYFSGSGFYASCGVETKTFPDSGKTAQVQKILVAGASQEALKAAAEDLAEAIGDMDASDYESKVKYYVDEPWAKSLLVYTKNGDKGAAYGLAETELEYKDSMSKTPLAYISDDSKETNSNYIALILNPGEDGHVYVFASAADIVNKPTTTPQAVAATLNKQNADKENGGEGYSIVNATAYGCINAATAKQKSKNTQLSSSDFSTGSAYALDNDGIYALNVTGEDYAYIGLNGFVCNFDGTEEKGSCTAAILGTDTYVKDPKEDHAYCAQAKSDDVSGAWQNLGVYWEKDTDDGKITFIAGFAPCSTTGMVAMESAYPTGNLGRQKVTICEKGKSYECPYDESKGTEENGYGTFSSNWCGCLSLEALPEIEIGTAETGGSPSLSVADKGKVETTADLGTEVTKDDANKAKIEHEKQRATLANQAWRGIVSVSEDAWDGVTSAGEVVWDGTKYVTGATWDGTKYVGGAAWDATKYVGQSIGEGAQTVWDGTKYVTGATWDGTKYVGGAIWDATKYVGNTLYTTSPADIVSGIGTGAQAVWDGTKYVTGATWDGTKYVGGAAWDATKYVGQSIGEGAQAVWDGTKYVGGAVWNGTTYVGEQIGEGAQAVWDGTKYVTGATWDGTKYVGGAAWDATKYVGQSIGEGAQAVWDGTKYVTGATWDGTKYVGGAAWDASIYVGEQIGEGSEYAISAIDSGATSTWNYLAEASDENTKELNNKIGNPKDGTIHELEGVEYRYTDGKWVVDDVWDATKLVTFSAGSGIADGAEYLYTKTNEYVVNPVWTSTKDASSATWDVTKSIANTLYTTSPADVVSGIGTGAQTVWDGTKYVTGATWDGTKYVGGATWDGTTYVGEQIGEGAQTVWDGTKYVTGATWDGTKYVGGATWDGTTYVGEQIGEGAQTVWDGTKYVTGATWDGTKYVGGATWDGTKYVGNTLYTTSPADIVSGIGTGAQATGTGIANAAGYIWDGNTESGKDATPYSIVGMTSTTGNAISNMASWTYGATKTGAVGIKDATIATTNALSNAASKTGTAVKSGTIAVYDGTVYVFKASGDWVTGTAWPKIGEFTTSTGKTIGATGTYIYQASPKKVVDDIKSVFVSTTP